MLPRRNGHPQVHRLDTGVLVVNPRVRPMVEAETEPPSPAVFPAGLDARAEHDGPAQIKTVTGPVKAGHRMQLGIERGRSEALPVGLAEADPSLTLVADAEPHSLAERPDAVSQIVAQVSLATRLCPAFKNLPARDRNAGRCLGPADAARLRAAIVQSHIRQPCDQHENCKGSVCHLRLPVSGIRGASDCH
uniref:Uncharacterized protein n=1 Tax=uncultured Rhodobacterales bacterium HF4000_03E16 TaxID=710785 RepID=E0XV85_9RHOB|nr:hypothetical protein [uncultured Rhodobacterales bacterium HF4000_03E16]